MKTIKEFLMPLALVLLAGVVLYDHIFARPVSAPHPSPPATVNGSTLGKAFAPILLATYSDAWLAAARTLEAGKPVAEAQTALQSTWKDERVKAFTDHVSPSFTQVLPEGTEPTTPEKRAEVVRLWRAFAQGLKAGR